MIRSLFVLVTCTFILSGFAHAQLTEQPLSLAEPSRSDELIPNDDIEFHWQPLSKLPHMRFAVAPEGGLKTRPSALCDPRVWEQNFLLQPNQSREAIESFFSQCESQWDAFAGTAVTNLIGFERVRDQLTKKSSIRKVTFSLASGELVFGLLGVHDDRPRPMILFICGTACGATDGMNQYAMMHLYEESGFNVVAIGSTTSTESVVANRRVAIGGIEEGIHTIEIMKYLSGPQSPVHNLISSWHIMGASLGGQSAFYASILLSQNRIPEIQAPVLSTIAYCPVIDLQPTLEALDDKLYIGKQFRKTLKQIGQELLKVMGDKSPIQPDDLDALHKGNLAETIGRVSFPYLNHLKETKSLNLAPFSQEPARSVDDFWHLNNGFNYIQDIKIPTWIVYSENDPVVKPSYNGQKLQAQIGVDPNRNLFFVPQKHGAHCASMEAYGWPVISTLLRSIVEESRNSARHFVHTASLNDTMLRRLTLAPGRRISAYRWKVQSTSSARLTLSIFNPSRRYQNMACNGQSPNVAFEGCFDHIDVDLDLFKTFGSSFASEVSSIQQDPHSLTRWLNTRTVLVDAHLTPVVGTDHMPTTVKWISDLTP